MGATLRTEAVLDELPRIRAFVAAAAEAAGVERRGAYRLCLAVDEIVTNIVVHGQPGDMNGPAWVEVAAVAAPDSLTIVVEDPGRPFDPLARVPTAEALAQPIEQRPIGGLGVFLAIRGVDEFRYERRDGVNRNLFVVRLSAAVS